MGSREFFQVEFDIAVIADEPVPVLSEPKIMVCSLDRVVAYYTLPSSHTYPV